jgi:drug/metabolite transporter (DMT)-like permease
MSVPRKAAVAGLLTGATAIGLAPIFVRLSETGSTATAFWRVTLAVPFLWVWMRLEGRRRTFNWALLWPGVFFAGDLAVWHVSIRWTSVANATLLANAAPIFVALVAWLWWRERLRGTFVAGLVVALCGAALVMHASFVVSVLHLKGDWLAVVTALFYAGYQLSVKRLRATQATGALMFWAGLVSAAVLLPIALVMREQLMPSTTRGWLVLLALAVISHVGGQGLIAWALAHGPASASSVSLLWQPVVAAFAAWLVFGETLGASHAVGAVVVLVGIYLAWRGSRTS